MADKNLKFVIQGVDKLTPEMDKIAGNSEKMGKRVHSSGLMGKVGILAMAGAATAAATAIVKTGAEIESGMANISTIIDTGTESISDMEKEIIEMSKGTAVPLTDMIDSMYDIRSAGISASGAMNTLQASADLAVGGLGTTKEASNLLTSAINAFGLEAEDSEEIANVLFETVKAGKTTVSELAQSFGATAPVIAQAGFALEDFQAATAALTTTGLPASQAQNSLRQAVISLTKPTKEMSDLFTQLSVTGLPDMIEKGMTMGQIFSELDRAAGGNADTLTRAFGSVEAYGAAVGLANTVTESYESTLLGMNDTTNLLTDAVDKQNETMNAQVQLMKNQLSASMNELAKVGLPIVVVAVKSLTAFLSLLTEGLGLFIQTGTETFNAFKDVATSVFSSVESFLGGSLFNMVTAVRNFGSEFKKDWETTWTGAQTFFTDIWDNILAGLSSSLNFAIGLINKVISAMNSVPGVDIPKLASVSLGGSNSSPMPIEGRAMGGSVTGGTPYVVGEEGPELFVPKGSGSIVPNNQLGGVNITINNPTVDSDERMRQLSDMIEKKLARQMQLQRFGTT